MSQFIPWRSGLVPQSDVPGEQTWPTQPFPVKPPPLARLSITADEVFKGEPEHEKFCRDLVEKMGGIHNEGPYTPYSSKEYRVIFSGQQGRTKLRRRGRGPDEQLRVRQHTRRRGHRPDGQIAGR